MFSTVLFSFHCLFWDFAALIVWIVWLFWLFECVCQENFKIDSVQAKNFRIGQGLHFMNFGILWLGESFVEFWWLKCGHVGGRRIRVQWCQNRCQSDRPPSRGSRLSSAAPDYGANPLVSTIITPRPPPNPRKSFLGATRPEIGSLEFHSPNSIFRGWVDAFLPAPPQLQYLFLKIILEFSGLNITSLIFLKMPHFLLSITF